MPVTHHKPVKDLRNFQRATLKVAIEFGLSLFEPGKKPRKNSEPESERKRKGITAMIGCGGIFIQTEDFLPAGSEIWMKFKLPEEKHIIQAEGNVVWVIAKPNTNKRYPQPGMGVKFIRLDEPSLRIIDAYVTQKNRIFRELKFLMSQETPPMKKVNELLTSTYIRDYRSLDDLRKQIAWEMASFRFSRTN
ncbi:MAG: PilZ domain-containing protein [bacterium]|nr:PilZ domain-containing protein [bacterium]